MASYTSIQDSIYKYLSKFNHSMAIEITSLVLKFETTLHFNTITDGPVINIQYG